MKNGAPSRAAGHLAVRFEVSVDREDELVAELWAAGCLGSETMSGDALPGSSVAAAKLLRLRAYFPAERSLEELARVAARAGARVCSSEILPDQDWLASYRATARPFSVGDLFWIEPGDPERGAESAAEGRHRLRLPARRAFGTGSHATTALVLLVLEGIARHHRSSVASRRPTLAGLRVLDVGCGSGVLALAARRLGASKPIAFDTDITAIFVARENVALNATSVALFVGSMNAVSASAAFDLVLVNVLPENLRGHEAVIASVLARDGLLVVSGLLTEREEEIEARWRELGLQRRDRQCLDEWTALTFGAPSLCSRPVSPESRAASLPVPGAASRW